MLWTQAEHAATQALAKMTTEGAIQTDSADKEMEDSDAAVDAAIEIESRPQEASAESQKSVKRIAEALSEMKAATEDKSGREGSRTPRQSGNHDPDADKDKGSAAPSGKGGKGGPDADKPAGFQLGLQQPSVPGVART